MKHAGTAFLVVMLFSTLGLWGIAQQKNGNYASRLRDLEARHTRMEEEQRAMITQGERHQKRIGLLENEKTELSQQVEDLKVVVKERDELRGQLTRRTSERNEAQAQLVGRTQERDQISQDMKNFQRELQSMLGRMEASLATTRPGVTEATPASRRTE